jgi:mono/diheme cytochrome c family protein
MFMQLLKPSMFTRKSTFPITTVVALFFLAVSAWGQKQQLTAKIPFEFSIGKKVLQAGTYKFVPKSGSPWMTISSATQGSSSVGVISRLAANSFLRDATLVFDKSGDKRIMSEVWIPGGDGYLVHLTSPGHTHEVVIAAESNLSASLSGKDVFERTCANCHGQQGRGNEAADKFFKTTVPRLDSDYVQSKSDAELKEIIGEGRRNMDPVRVGSSTVQHLLSTQSIDAVVIYVRTLK